MWRYSVLQLEGLSLCFLTRSSFIDLKGPSAVLPNELRAFLSIPSVFICPEFISATFVFSMQVGHNITLRPYNNLHLSVMSFPECLL